MKVSDKLVEEVVAQVAGQDVIELVKILKDKKNISEFKLAEHAHQEINAIRNQLYRLYDSSLVSFTRKKDKQKGWYIYYWKRLEKLRERLTKEKANQYFLCTNACIRLNFEQSTDFSYKCPECANLLNQQDNSKTIEHIEQEIRDLQKQL